MKGVVYVKRLISCIILASMVLIYSVDVEAATHITWDLSAVNYSYGSDTSGVLDVPYSATYRVYARGGSGFGSHGAQIYKDCFLSKDDCVEYTIGQDAHVGNKTVVRLPDVSLQAGGGYGVKPTYEQSDKHVTRSTAVWNCGELGTNGVVYFHTCNQTKPVGNSVNIYHDCWSPIYHTHVGGNDDCDSENECHTTKTTKNIVRPHNLVDGCTHAHAGAPDDHFTGSKCGTCGWCIHQSPQECSAQPTDVWVLTCSKSTTSYVDNWRYSCTLNEQETAAIEPIIGYSGGTLMSNVLTNKFVIELLPIANIMFNNITTQYVSYLDRPVKLIIKDYVVIYFQR